MGDRRELTLTLHGLDAFNNDVDAEAFAKKLTVFLNAIRLSDKHVNGQRRHKLLLTDLRKGPAVAVVREQVFDVGPVPESGLEAFEQSLGAIAHRTAAARRVPLSVVREVVKLNQGSGRTFAFAEMKSSETGQVIRIDGFLGETATKLLKELEEAQRSRLGRFTGTTLTSFEGELKMADFRGDVWTGVLTLSAGGKEIQCTVDSMKLPDIRDALNAKVRAFGRAYYSGRTSLPERFEVLSAKVPRTREAANLSRWRGAFNIPDAEADIMENWQ